MQLDDSGRSESEGADRRHRVLLGVQVADRIAEHIRQHQLTDGEELPSEGRLADEYGVSQRVIRDAFRSLSQQGVIKTRQGKLAVVSKLRPVGVHDYFRLAVGSDDAALGELLELRLALETKAVSLAAPRITDDELAEMERQLDETVRSTDRGRRVKFDLAFHGAIVRAAHNRFFDAIFEALSGALMVAREHEQRMTDEAGASHVENDREHRAVLQAMKLRDGAVAERSMRAHFEAVQQRTRKLPFP